MSGGRGALLRNLAGVSQSSSSVVSSAATSRQEFLANLQQKRQEAAAANSVVPKPIGRAGLVSHCYFLVFPSFFSCINLNQPAMFILHSTSNLTTW